MKTEEKWSEITRVLKPIIDKCDLKPNELNNLINLLKRGEKYEQMWKKLKWIFKMPIASINGKFVLKGMKKIEQKYFPKEVK